MEKRIVLGLLTAAAFFIAQKGGKLFLMIDGYAALPYIQKAVLVRGVWYMLFPLLLLGLFHGFSKMGKEAGIATRARQGIGIGFLGAAPMLLGAAALAGFRIRLDPGSIFTGCVLAAVAEELLYRAFLFGQLFRHSRLGFFPAGLIGALIFGAGHLYQSQDPSTMAGIFLVTMMGGLWFSWLYVEWGYNLWVPISLHFFMNLSWNLFPVSENALGPLGPNIFRALTIILSIALTVWHKRRSGEAWIIRGRRWLADTPKQRRPLSFASPLHFLPLGIALLSLPLAAQAQRTLQGRVTDSQGRALPYVNVGLPETSLGTVSGMDGSFQLHLPDSIGSSRQVRFSMVGFESKQFRIDQLAPASGEGALEITLPEQAIELSEVTVFPQYKKTRTIGKERPGAARFVNFSISKLPNQNLGAEVGRKFRMPGKEAMVEQFHLYVAQNNFDTLRLRINAYALENGRPGAPLMRENILVELTGKKTGWIAVDLRPYQIIAREDIVLAAEWVYYAGKGTYFALPISVPSDGVHFYQYGSQGSWKKFPMMSAAMYLTVSW